MRTVLFPVVLLLTMSAALPAQPALGEMKSAPTIGGDPLEVWIKRLSDPDPSARDAAVRVIPSFGKPAQKAIPMLIAMMVKDGEDMTVRVSAMVAVTANSFDDEKQLKSIVTNVLALLKSTQASTKIQAALAAARIGKEARGLTGQLADYTVRDPISYEVRRAGAVALGKVGFDAAGAPDKRAVASLLTAVADPALAVRSAAIQGLLALGVPSKPDEIEYEWNALQRRIDPKAARHETDAGLLLWLRVAVIRINLFLALDPANPKASAYKKEADEMMTVIAKALGDEKLRTIAAEAIAGLGKYAFPKLADMLIALRNTPKDKPEHFAFINACLWAIGQMGPDAKLAAGADVAALMTHADANVKFFATEANDRLNAKKK